MISLSATPSIALRVERLEIGDRLGDTLLELVEARFVVLEFRRLGAGEAAGTVLGMVAGNLHLAEKREHVGREPRTEQHRRIDFLRRGKGRGLVEHARQRIEADLEDRQGGLDME